MPDFSALRLSLLLRLQAAPYTAASMGVLLVSAYLCLVNLDYAALWHDEAVPAFMGKNLLKQGDIIGWDGRNLVGGTNGQTLNEDLRDPWPPLMYVLNAVGFAIFGVNEIGARVVHAVIGIVALGVFYLLLRQHLPEHPRLMFFIFVFAAGSAQLLLYFRQSRYFSVMILTLILLFYTVRTLLAEQASGLPAGPWASGRAVVFQSLRRRRGNNAIAGGISPDLSRSRDHSAGVGAVRHLRCGCRGGGFRLPLLDGRHRRRAQRFHGIWWPKSHAVPRRQVGAIHIHRKNLDIYPGAVHRRLDFMVGILVVRGHGTNRLAGPPEAGGRSVATGAATGPAGQRWRIHCPKDTRRRLPTSSGRKKSS